MHVEVRRGTFSISTDPAHLDIQAIHAFLSQAYWSAGIPRSVVERAIAGSLCFGIYDSERQVGFARVITDKATYAYLADVFVIDEYRGKGLAKWLMEVIMSHDSVQGLRRFTLATRDAHGLYAQFGFQPLHDPMRHMEIRRPDIYSASA